MNDATLSVLVNPKTPEYYNFKQHVLSGTFEWYWFESVDNEDTPKYDKEKYTNISFYSHGFLRRPEGRFRYPYSNSPYTDTVSSIFREILEHNNVKVNSFMRIGANCVHPQPQSKVVNSVPHFDHYFPHKNALIYLTDAGGDTYVMDKSHSPSEDDVIVFEGEHYMQTPLEKRRVVLVATFV